uniref:Uncharacterized protein n=1 Tax=Chinook aquareovirus TaxID=2587490 RepID=A0A5B9NBM4_9REOV|nr:MAG: hypothetical protein [Chinook aquareovirus]
MHSLAIFPLVFISLVTCALAFNSSLTVLDNATSCDAFLHTNSSLCNVSDVVLGALLHYPDATVQFCAVFGFVPFKFCNSSSTDVAPFSWAYYQRNHSSRAILFATCGFFDAGGVTVINITLPVNISPCKCLAYMRQFNVSERTALRLMAHSAYTLAPGCAHVVSDPTVSNSTFLEVGMELADIISVSITGLLAICGFVLGIIYRVKHVLRRRHRYSFNTVCRSIRGGTNPDAIPDISPIAALDTTPFEIHHPCDVSTTSSFMPLPLTPRTMSRAMEAVSDANQPMRIIRSKTPCSWPGTDPCLRPKLPCRLSSVTTPIYVPNEATYLDPAKYLPTARPANYNDFCLPPDVCLDDQPIEHTHHTEPQ